MSTRALCATTAKRLPASTWRAVQPGGLEGGPQVGYVGGLVKCGVTALIAAEHIAAKEHVA